MDDFEYAIGKFKDHKYADGFQAIGNALREIKAGITECDNVLEAMDKIDDVVAELSDPVALVVTSGWHIFWHVREITEDIKGAIDDWDHENYFDFGKDIGEITSIVLVGQPTPVASPTQII